MSLIPETDPNNPPADPGAQPPAAAAEGQEAAPAPEGAPERPEWLPEALWGESGFNAEAFGALAARPEPQEGVPAAPEGYELPQIEGFDAAEATDSPLFAALRKHAHANGMGQEAFAATIRDYVTAEQARVNDYEAQQVQALGANADQRLRALGSWLDSSLPPEQAAAVRAMATDAKAVAGLEALMNARGTVRPRGDTPTPAPADTEADIRKLMTTPAYRGKAHERDPAVIARVEAFFTKQAQANKA